MKIYFRPSLKVISFGGLQNVLVESEFVVTDPGFGGESAGGEIL